MVNPLSDIPTPPAVPARTLYSWFSATARRHPDETALEVQDLRLTYAELRDVVERLAGRIVAGRDGPPGRVGLLAVRSLTAYAGYLATLRIGATVVPLNPIYPPSRNLAIAAAADLDVVLLDDAGAEQLPEFRPGTAADLIDLSGATWRTLLTGALPADLPPAETDPSGLAYILFTSGSTGRPKGVPIQHANVSPYITHNIVRYAAQPGARFSQTFDLTFDPSVFDLFIAWGSGAALVVPQKNEVLAPVRYVRDRGITHWFSVPSVVSFARRLRALAPGAMPSLRWSLFAGEQLTIDQAAAWSRAAPGSTIENIYGPTELTITCVGYRLPADPAVWPRTANGTVPIGRIYPFLEDLIVDEDGRPTDDGELCVRGPMRFPGYLDPANNVGRFLCYDGATATATATVYDGSEPLTAEHWYRTGDRVNVEDGQMVHLGRLDHQLKIRGYRVELGEIEVVLRGHPRVQEAVVLAQTAPDGEIDLLAAYTGEPVPDDDLVALVRARLPVYMLPRRFEHVPRLPLNANGKMDRRRLAEQLAAVTV